MTCYLVSYDLIKNKDYTRLQAAITSFPWMKILLSQWIILSDLDIVTLRDHLSSYMDSDDKLFIVQLPKGSIAAWVNLPTEDSQWLLNNL
ncbi:MAG TPA: hypothetical protein VK958_06390 [Methylophilus sp.]|uniref:hypothetical protein n=1 Tax=Methylophilus sp. TaxID=29541 RepID=UPI002CD32657|nr:hypothetical protein [Methylophilus sp.]HSH86863.1 hypothetical protein [Methylophilus sp.]